MRSLVTASCVVGLMPILQSCCCHEANAFQDDSSGTSRLSEPRQVDGLIIYDMNRKPVEMRLAEAVTLMLVGLHTLKCKDKEYDA